MLIINHDDHPSDVIHKVNQAMSIIGQGFVSDGKEYDGYELLTLCCVAGPLHSNEEIHAHVLAEELGLWLIKAETRNGYAVVEVFAAGGHLWAVWPGSSHPWQWNPDQHPERIRVQRSKV